MQIFELQLWKNLIDDPIDRQIEQTRTANEERQNAERAEQVLRPFFEAGEEVDREQIEKALYDSRDAVFAVAELSRAVVDDDLASDGTAAATATTATSPGSSCRRRLRRRCSSAASYSWS